MNIEAILKEMETVAADGDQVQYQSPAQCALLRGVAAIKTLQGRILIQEAEALFFSVNDRQAFKQQHQGNGK